MSDEAPAGTPGEHDDDGVYEDTRLRPEVMSALKAHMDRYAMKACTTCGSEQDLRIAESAFHLVKGIIQGVWVAVRFCVRCGNVQMFELSRVEGFDPNRIFEND